MLAPQFTVRQGGDGLAIFSGNGDGLIVSSAQQFSLCQLWPASPAWVLFDAFDNFLSEVACCPLPELLGSVPWFFLQPPSFAAI